MRSFVYDAKVKLATGWSRGEVRRRREIDCKSCSRAAARLRTVFSQSQPALPLLSLPLPLHDSDIHKTLKMAEEAAFKAILTDWQHRIMSHELVAIREGLIGADAAARIVNGASQRPWRNHVDDYGLRRWNHRYYGAVSSYGNVRS